jgi:thiol:disulfide interchange protein DsbA
MSFDEGRSRRHGVNGHSHTVSIARRKALTALALAAAGLKWSQPATAQCRDTSIDPSLARQPGNSLPYRDLRPDPPGSSDPRCAPPSARRGTVVIEEFFTYGCDACSALDEGLADLQRKSTSDIRVVRVPTTDSALARLQARAFFTATRLGKIDRLHEALYEASRSDSSIEALATLFASAGVERDTFVNELDSLEVYLEVDRASSMSRRYGVTGAPALVVGGRYLTSPAIAGSSEAMLAAVADRAAALGSPG